MNDQVATPADETKASALSLFLKECAANKTKPNKTDQKAVGAKFKAFQQKKAAAVAAVEALAAEELEVSKEAIRCFGKSPVMVDGVRYVATSRDARIYYKEMSGAAIEL